MARPISYDESIIAEFARRLYQRAMSIIVWCTILGVIAGGAFSSAVTARMGEDGKGLVIALFLLLGALIGYFIGSERAFTLKLQAQVALCQAQIERNTRAAASMQYGPGPR